MVERGIAGDLLPSIVKKTALARLKGTSVQKTKARLGWKAVLRRKMTPGDAHYTGGLVAGATVLEMFGDAATALCLRESGCEGLFRAYQSVDFLNPVHVGDTIVATATITKVGHTSRQMKFVAHKLGRKKVIVAKAIGTVVIPELAV